jgi:hypothetical protein
LETQFSGECNVSKWAEMKDGLIGQVVVKHKLPSGLALGLDLNGEGGIYYVMARDVKPFDLVKPQKVAAA